MVFPKKAVFSDKLFLLYCTVKLYFCLCDNTVAHEMLKL